MHYKVMLKRMQETTYFCRGTALTVTYSKCVAYSFSILYRYLWSAWIYGVFPHFLINCTDYGQTLQNI